MDTISSASLAFDLHTRYLQHRKGHPTMDRLLHLGYFRAYAGLESPEGIDLDTTVSRHTMEAEFERSRVYHEVARTLDDAILARADTVFLTDDLRELVKTAEATMPDEVLFETDIYTPCGFIVMETPLRMDISSRMKASEFDELVTLALAKYKGEVRGARLYAEPDENGDYIGTEHWEVQAFSWALVDSIKPEAMSDIERAFGTDSEQHKFAQRVFFSPAGDEKGLYVRVFGTMTSTTVDGLTLDVPAMGSAPLRLMDLYAFFFGEDGLREEEEIHGVGKSEGGEMYRSSWERSREIRRFLLALFRLMEEYVEVEKHGLHRAFGKRATRGGRVGEPRDVTVLSLRRAMDDDDESSGAGRKVTLAHLVRGHWRNQWYPSQKMHRAKWIRAHRRGGNAGDEVTARPRIIKVDR